MSENIAPDSAALQQLLRLRLDILYDGTDFSGWAIQPGRRTVAGVIGDALQILFRTPVRIVVAGRTDAGVHASGQVAHIDVATSSLRALTPRHLANADAPLSSALVGLRRRLAGILPPDVRIPAVSLVPTGFDARFAALRRHYHYRIISSDWGAPPLTRFNTLTWRRPLDADRMQRAAQQLLGLHDFAAYCKPREGATTIRQLQQLDVTAVPLAQGHVINNDALAADRADQAATLVTINVSADAFCHSMVRSLVGALLSVGEGRRDVDHPARLLAAKQRTSEIGVAPARGLTLVAVDYPPDAELAARIEQTRAVRSTTDCDC